MFNQLIGFYGCAKKHRIKCPGVICVHNDIDLKCYCDYSCDIRDILSGHIIPGIYLEDFDFYIFTPPCNYYSRGNYRRESSNIALSTKDLLPLCLQFCVNQNKPFIVENVMNKTLLGDIFPQYQFAIAGHTYWSNFITIEDVKHLPFIKNQNKNFISPSKRDNNPNVHMVFDVFINKLKSLEFNALVTKYQVFLNE